MNHCKGSVTEQKKKNGKPYYPKHWRVCLSFGGRSDRKKVQRITMGSKKDAYTFMEELAAQYDERGNKLSEIVKEEEKRELEGTTLTQMIDIWHEARKNAGRASERIMREDRRKLKYIEKHIGTVPVKDITPQIVEATYAAVRKERNLSGTSMNHLHVLLKKVFSKAVDYDYIYKNPCERVDAPKRNTPTRQSLTAEESARLLKKLDASELEAYAALEAKEYRMDHIGKNLSRTLIRGVLDLSCLTGVRIALATGMRRGEIMGLTWDHVDFKRQSLNVCQALGNQDNVKVPKTAAGIRNVALDEVTLAHLYAWKERQAFELAKLDIEATSKTPVCCSNVGSWLNVDNFSAWWRTWREREGFKGLKLHELRHTQATLLLANGVDVKTVQTRLGHANPSITLSWYAHSIPQNDFQAARMLGNLLGGEPKKETDEGPIRVPAVSPQANFAPVNESRPDLQLVV